MDQALVRRYFLAGYVYPRREDREPDRSIIGAVLPDVERQLDVIESALAKTPYLSGDGFSLADINLMPILFYLKNTQEAGARIDNSPTLDRLLRAHFKPSELRQHRASGVTPALPGAGLTPGAPVIP